MRCMYSAYGDAVVTLQIFDKCGAGSVEMKLSNARHACARHTARGGCRLETKLLRWWVCLLVMVATMAMNIEGC